MSLSGVRQRREQSVFQFWEGKAMRPMLLLRVCLLAAVVWLAAAPAFGQQYQELPPNSVIGNVLGQSNPSFAVPFDQLAAQLMLHGGLVQGPLSATAGHAAVFGSGPNVLVDGGGVAGTGTVTQVNCGFGLSGGSFSTAGTCAQDGNYSGWALQNCTLASSVGSNILTVSLKDNAGNDPSATSPCQINYRSAGAAIGATALVAQTAALSINTNATGATLGASSNVAFRFWVVAFNNGGTNVLGLINCSTSSGIFPLNEAQLTSSTPISNTATSAGVFYTPSGTTISSKAFRILGYIEYNSTGLATAGTYASVPNFIQIFGPGIKKPGDVVQSVYATALVGQSGITATSFAAVTNSAFPTLTPTSAVNPLRYNIVVQGTASLVSSTNTSLIATVARSTTPIGPTMTGTAFAGGIGVAWSGSLAFAGIDQPNSTSALTYQMMTKATGSGAQVSVTGISGTIDEIQG